MTASLTCLCGHLHGATCPHCGCTTYQPDPDTPCANCDHVREDHTRYPCNVFTRNQRYVHIGSCRAELPRVRFAPAATKCQCPRYAEPSSPTTEYRNHQLNQEIQR